MAQSYHKLNDPKKALELAEECLRIYRKLQGEISPNIADAYNLIGTIYKYQK